MKRLIVAAIYLLIVSTSGRGQIGERNAQWKLVELMDDGREIYVQNKRRVTKSGTLKVWVKVENVRPDREGTKGWRGSGLNLPQVDKGVTILYLNEYNCKEEMFRTHTEIWYVKEKSFSEDTRGAWKDVIPESIGESILRAVCKK